jgi:hypothetical protein
MTDQQHATICRRCGGMAERCECAELRREGMLMAAKVALEPFLPCDTGGSLIMDRYQGEVTANAILALARKEPL